MKKTIAILMVLTLAVPFSLLADPGFNNRGGDRDCPWGYSGLEAGSRGPGDGLGCFGRGDFRGHGLMAMAEELGLTDAQQEQLDNMRHQFQMGRIDARAELEKAELELRNLMRDEAGEREVLQQIDRVSQIKGQMQKDRYSHQRAMSNVLTDAQKEKLEQLRLERRERSPEDADARPGMGGGKFNRGRR